MPEPTPRPQPAPECKPTPGPREWCAASARTFGRAMPHIGPCVLRAGHDGPVHQDENGAQWTEPTPRPDVPDGRPLRPADVPDDLIRIATEGLMGLEVRRVIVNVWPGIARRVREQVAAERRREPDSLTVYPAHEGLYGRCPTCGEVRWHTEFHEEGRGAGKRSSHCGCCTHAHDLEPGGHEIANGGSR